MQMILSAITPNGPQSQRISTAGGIAGATEQVLLRRRRATLPRNSSGEYGPWTGEAEPTISYWHRRTDNDELEPISERAELPGDRRKLVLRLRSFESKEWRNREPEGTDDEIEAVCLQKMKAILADKWDALSLRADFEQNKGDFAEELKGDLANYISDVFSVKEANKQEAATICATLRIHDTSRFFRGGGGSGGGDGGGGGGGAGGSGHEDYDDNDDDPNGMYADSPS